MKSVIYDPLSGSYTLRINAQESTFFATDRNVRHDDALNYANGADLKFDVYGKPAPSGDQSQPYMDDLLIIYTGRLYKPVGGVTSYIDFSYTKLAEWKHRIVTAITGRADTNNTLEQRTFIVFGFDTVDADMPRSGSASYDTFVYGSLVEPGATLGQNVVDLRGKVSFTADFGARTVSTQLDLQRWTTVNGSFAFGTLAGGGNMGGANIFSGALTGSSGAEGYTGSYIGGFYGPAAKEMGFTFSASKTGSEVVGAVIGVRQ